MSAYEVLRTKPIYKGLIFNVTQKIVRLPDGREAPRDMLEMTGAAAIIPVMDDGRILFVRQYREAARMQLIEIPAGKLDAGEEPLTCAERELEEETGYRASSLQFLFKFFPAAAYNDEQLYIYLAEGLTPGEPKPDEDEFLTPEAIDLQTALSMIDDGRIIDAKTIASLLYYDRMRRNTE